MRHPLGENCATRHKSATNQRKGKMENKVEAESITLKTENGAWLGQVVLTSDGFFASVTDWGNFSYTWRSFGEEKTLPEFKRFLSGLDIGYFSCKMVTGVAYTAHSKAIEKSCDRYSMHIFPALKEYLKKDVAQVTLAERQK